MKVSRFLRLAVPCWALSSFVTACGSAPSLSSDPAGPIPVSSVAPPKVDVLDPPDRAASASNSNLAAGSASASPPGPAAVPAVRFAGAPFPPAKFEPMYKRTAKDDDGTWKPIEEGRLGDRDTIAYATIHPHKIKKWVFVTAVAFDRRYTDLTLLAGTDEPVSESVPKERRPGLIPPAHHGALLSVFNGGFKVRHGDYGMMAAGDVYAPPIDDACTVALDRDGGLHLAPWPELRGKASRFLWYRQTPPCLVMDSKPNPRLKSEHRTRLWGAAVGGVYDIRRSAIALDPSGRSLLYVFGDWVTAGDLAAALVAMGVKQAAQLDINWSYTRFFLFEQRSGHKPRIKRTLIPKLKFSRNRYVEKPSYRDFFYVTARP